VTGCQPRARPWDQGDAEAPPPPSARPSGLVLPAVPAAPAVPAEPGNLGAPAQGSDGGPDASSAAGEAEEPEPPTPPVRVGGPWVRCYGNFRPSGDPVKDVTRLSLLCGPENGMHRLSRRPIEGAVAEGGPGVTEPLEARRGECYRIFAVAEPTVVDLDVTVQSSRGAAIAADHSEDSWPIVQPDRPFCPLADDRAALEITARRGRGRFAAEVWVLRSPKAPGEPGKAPGESATEGARRPPPIDRIPSGE
jgi:hypothetical protein